ncbi:uncharacterized protein F5147DRAFT_351581 [Suillus discolor]|uniref:Uncharacterized protein n=1 Tax=Suillus discolor TaxID=1912936 RepID=A0A9P7JYT4_9AGAM|nr:uncharacterized protein F5147DRAFT_351581 [Suillus discolor]KAG2116648.1 hypothetical protein F5147DRAFT_351581 [Suillus discolor]
MHPYFRESNRLLQTSVDIRTSVSSANPTCTGPIYPRTPQVFNPMYDRAHLALKPLQISTGLRYRFETLIGVTGYKMAKYRPRWSEVLMMAGSSNGIFGCRLASSVFLRSSL